MGVFLFTLMIPMLIQWLGVQMFEEDRRKDIKEGKNLNMGEFYKWNMNL